MPGDSCNAYVANLYCFAIEKAYNTKIAKHAKFAACPPPPVLVVACNDIAGDPGILKTDECGGDFGES